MQEFHCDCVFFLIKRPHYFRSGVPAHRFTKEFLSLLSQNVENLDVGLELEL